MHNFGMRLGYSIENHTKGGNYMKISDNFVSVFSVLLYQSFVRNLKVDKQNNKKGDVLL